MNDNEQLKLYECKKEIQSKKGLEPPKKDNAHLIHSMAYLSFLENPILTPQAKIIYLHLSARGGDKGTLWHNKESLGITLGFSKSTYLKYLNELETQKYIVRLERHNPKDGSKLSEMICINPIDNYTGLPILNDDEIINHKINISKVWFSSKEKDSIIKHKITNSTETNTKLKLKELEEMFKYSLKDELNEVSYNTWIEPLKLRLTDNTVIIKAQSSFIATIIKDKYYSLILAKLQFILKKEDIVVNIES